MGRYYINKSEWIKAAYYLSLSLSKYNDKTSGFLLSNLFWSLKVKNISELYNPSLAEHMLCQYASSGELDAIISLGKLYFSKPKDCEGAQERGIKLLEFSANVLNDDESQQILNSIKLKKPKSYYMNIALGIGIALTGLFAAYQVFKSFKK